MKRPESTQLFSNSGWLGSYNPLLKRAPKEDGSVNQTPFWCSTERQSLVKFILVEDFFHVKSNHRGEKTGVGPSGVFCGCFEANGEGFTCLIRQLTCLTDLTPITFIFLTSLKQEVKWFPLNASTIGSAIAVLVH